LNVVDVARAQEAGTFVSETWGLASWHEAHEMGLCRWVRLSEGTVGGLED
jgi:hypothetical protein